MKNAHPSRTPSRCARVTLGLLGLIVTACGGPKADDPPLVRVNDAPNRAPEQPEFEPKKDGGDDGSTVSPALSTSLAGQLVAFVASNVSSEEGLFLVDVDRPGVMTQVNDPLVPWPESPDWGFFPGGESLFYLLEPHDGEAGSIVRTI